MRKVLLAIALLLLFSAASHAAFNIHLKNGSVFKGVPQYEEVDGELRFRYLGGTVGIPLDNVENIEATGGAGVAPETGTTGTTGIRERSKPVVPAYQKEPLKPAVDTGPIKRKIAEIDKRLAVLNAAISDYDDKKEEYDKVRLRIEVLFQKGIAAAKNVNGDPAKWFQYLPPQEREWAQLNTLKKNKLKKELEDLDVRMAPAISERNSLLGQKKSLEQELKEAESLY
jgi:hypothetical protein